MYNFVIVFTLMSISTILRVTIVFGQFTMIAFRDMRLILKGRVTFVTVANGKQCELWYHTL